MRAETLAAADHQARHRAVHHRGWLRRRAGLDDHHDALPGTGHEAGGVEHRRRRLRLVRARRPLHHAEHPGGPRDGHQGAAARRRVEGTHRGESGERGRASWRSTPTSSSRSCCAGSTRSCPSPARPFPASPTRVRRHQGPHADHPRRRERLGSPQADLTRSELPDQGFQAHRSAVARGCLGARRREVRRQRRKKFCLFDTWVKAAPAILDFLEK